MLRSFDKRFWSRVRGMLERTCWVFATRVEIREVSPDSPLVNRLGLVRLGLLEAEAAETLIAAGGLAAERAALMREWAGRHPFYLQLLGRHLGDYPDTGDALEHFRDEAANRLAELWRALGPRDCAALKGWQTGGARDRPGLRLRGLVDERGRPFGRVLAEWLNEQN